MDYIPVFDTPAQEDIGYVEFLEPGQSVSLKASKDGDLLMKVDDNAVSFLLGDREYNVEGIEALFKGFDARTENNSSVENYAQETARLASEVLQDSLMREMIETTEKVPKALRVMGKDIARYTEMVYHPENYSPKDIDEARLNFVLTTASANTMLFNSRNPSAEMTQNMPAGENEFPVKIQTVSGLKFMIADVNKYSQVNELATSILRQDKSVVSILNHLEKQQKKINESSKFLFTNIVAASHAYNAEVSKDTVHALEALMRDVKKFEDRYGDRVDVAESFMDRNLITDEKDARMEVEHGRLLNKFAKVCVGVLNARTLIEENINYPVADSKGFISGKAFLKAMESNVKSYEQMNAAVERAATDRTFGRIINDYVLPGVEAEDVRQKADAVRQTISVMREQKTMEHTGVKTTGHTDSLSFVEPPLKARPKFLGFRRPRITVSKQPPVMTHTNDDSLQK